MVLHHYMIFDDAFDNADIMEHLFGHQPWDANVGDEMRPLLDMELLPVDNDQTLEWIKHSDQTDQGSTYKVIQGKIYMEVLLGTSLYELYGATDGGFDSFNALKFKTRMHNGHVSVRRQHVLEAPLSMQWEDISTNGQTFGEDVRFVKTVLSKLGKRDSTAAYIPAALSKYMVCVSASFFHTCVFPEDWVDF